MDVTVDIKTLFIILVFIALIILIVFGIILLRKLLVTLDHANTVLEDVEKISAIAASRSQDIDGIVDDVSKAASELSGAMSGTSFISAVSSVAKAGASLKGLMSEEDKETRAAKKYEKKAARVHKRRARD